MLWVRRCDFADDACSLSNDSETQYHQWIEAFLEQLSHPHVQRGALEILLLSATAGAIGPWILMRGLGFFSHATGSAAFPGLILADAIGILPQAGATVAAAGVAAGAGVVRPSARNGARTALWLTGAIAAGSLIASNWSRAGAGVDAALFGSVLTSGWNDIGIAAIALIICLTSVIVGRERWLKGDLLAQSVPGWDGLLLAATGIAVIAQLPVTGALLASALLLLPASAARFSSTTLSAWQALTAATAAATGLGGLALSVALDTPPGGTIAVISGLVVAAAAASRDSAMRRLGITTGAAAGACVLLLIGCAPRKAADVVTGTPIVGAIATEVAGPDLTVRSLVPAGADPHAHEPRPSDIDALAGARLLATNGAGLDSWTNRLRSRTESGSAVVDLWKDLPNRRLATNSSRPDPHWFHDPDNVAAAAMTLADAFARLDPPDAAAFRRRARAVSGEARRLDLAARRCAALLAPGERRLVTDHDAFAYLADDLGLRVEGSLLQSQSTAAYPAPVDLARLVKSIQSNGIKAIFPERALDPRLARSIARQSGASADTQLDADTLGSAGSAGNRWATMWAGNVDRILGALSGGRIACRLTVARTGGAPR